MASEQSAWRAPADTHLHRMAERMCADTCVCACCVLQILQLYKDYIDPEFSWSNFTVEEQAKVIVAPRSNNLLDTERVSAVSSLQTATKLQSL